MVERKRGEDGTVVGDQPAELVEGSGVEIIGGDPTPNRYSEVSGARLQTNRRPSACLHTLSVGFLEVPGGDDLGLVKIHPKAGDLAEEVDEGYDVVSEEGEVGEDDYNRESLKYIVIEAHRCCILFPPSTQRVITYTL